MSASAQAARPRPGGGFNQGMGQFGEHMDETAMENAILQKGMSQQGGSTSNVPTPKPASPQAQAQPKAPPREMGSFTDELFVNPAKDFWQGIKSIFDLRTALGLNEKTPEQQQELARQEVILKRFNQLTDEQQAIARERYQQELAKKQQEEQEKQQRAEAERQSQSQTIQAPSKAASGPHGPGMSGKQKAKAQVDWDRQRKDSTQSAG